MLSPKSFQFPALPEARLAQALASAVRPPGIPRPVLWALPLPTAGFTQEVTQVASPWDSLYYTPAATPAHRMAEDPQDIAGSRF